jgi:hypothetical protein
MLWDDSVGSENEERKDEDDKMKPWLLMVASEAFHVGTGQKSRLSPF